MELRLLAHARSWSAGCGAVEAEGCVPVDLAETANTDGLAHVDVAGDGGGADVEPVDVLGRQLVGVCVHVLDAGAVQNVCKKLTRCLDGINPTCR